MTKRVCGRVTAVFYFRSTFLVLILQTETPCTFCFNLINRCPCPRYRCVVNDTNACGRCRDGGSGGLRRNGRASSVGAEADVKVLSLLPPSLIIIEKKRPALKSTSPRVRRRGINGISVKLN